MVSWTIEKRFVVYQLISFAIATTGMFLFIYFLRGDIPWASTPTGRNSKRFLCFVGMGVFGFGLAMSMPTTKYKIISFAVSFGAMAIAVVWIGGQIGFNAADPVSGSGGVDPESVYYLFDAGSFDIGVNATLVADAAKTILPIGTLGVIIVLIIYGVQSGSIGPVLVQVGLITVIMIVFANYVLPAF